MNDRYIYFQTKGEDKNLRVKENISLNYNEYKFMK